MRLGPIAGLIVFVGIVGACLENDAEPPLVMPSSAIAVATKVDGLVTVPASEEVETTTTDALRV